MISDFMKEKLEKATFGEGCFWCSEAIFKRIAGVKSVESGYSGGHVENPSYEEVCSGNTGHAEAIQITFDLDKISFGQILEIFWKSHDPTTLNRQGSDVGAQYRSVIFYHDEEQRKIAEASKKKAQKEFSKPIVTAIEPFRKFFKAENYHQDYFNRNQNAPYCRLVILPKLQKLKKENYISAKE